MAKWLYGHPPHPQLPRQSLKQYNFVTRARLRTEDITSLLPKFYSSITSPYTGVWPSAAAEIAQMSKYKTAIIATL